MNQKLEREIREYCTLNKIEDFELQVEKFIQIGFNVTRFGNSPFAVLKKPSKDQTQQEENKPEEEMKVNPVEAQRKKETIAEEVPKADITTKREEGEKQTKTKKTKIKVIQ